MPPEKQAEQAMMVVEVLWRNGKIGSHCRGFYTKMIESNAHAGLRRPFPNWLVGGLADDIIS